MPYAAITDLISRYGERELIANTTPAGQDRDRIDATRVAQSLTDASDLIDGYLNRRYAVPLAEPTPSIVAACCKIARYDLAQNGETIPTEQMRDDRRDTLMWLRDIASGKVSLDGIVPANETQTFLRISTRRPGQRCGELW